MATIRGIDEDSAPRGDRLNPPASRLHVLCAVIALMIHGVWWMPAYAAQVVLVTHGFNSGTGDWVGTMTDRMAEYTTWWGDTASCYQITVSTNSAGEFVVASELIGGVPADQSGSGNIFVKLDWSNVAGSVRSVPFQIFPAPFATDVIAEAVVPKLVDTAFMPDLQGHALAELPLHLVGHSRGASLISEMARLLGGRGIEVDQLTFLDPHPCVGNVFPDSAGCPVFDPQPTLFANTQFADNYFQINADLFELDGQSITGAYNRQLTSLAGGYGGGHSNAHLWYHGTIDLGTPASDGLASIGGAERSGWYAAGETNGAWAGFLYSRIGGGDRSSTNRPSGPGLPAIVEGLNGTRQPLASNSREWPNLLKVRLWNDGFDYTAPPGPAARHEGVVHPDGRLSFEVGYTHSAAESDTLSFYLDTDANPFNGLGHPIADDAIPDVPGSPTWYFSRTITLTNAPAFGVYHVAAVIQNESRRRILYSPQKAAVLPPLQLALQRNGELAIHGAEGYGAIVEQSRDFDAWDPAGTFVFPADLPGNPGTLQDTIGLNDGPMFFRGRYFRP